MSSCNIYYTYVYLDTRKPGFYSYCGLNNERFTFEYEPFWVGKGKNDRMVYHIGEANRNFKNGNQLFLNKIRKIISKTLEVPIVEKYIDNLTELDAFDLETLMIMTIGRSDKEEGPLCNLTDGGEGSSGCSVSDETRKKLSNLRKGEKNSFFGKTHTDEVKNFLKQINKGKILTKEHKSNISKSLIGEQHPFFGKNHTKESISKISTSMSGENHWLFGKSHPQSTKDKISVSMSGEKNPMFGHKFTKEHRNKLSGKNNPKSKSVLIDGILYESQCIAAKSIGVSVDTIRYRILNSKPGYRYHTG